MDEHERDHAPVIADAETATVEAERPPGRIPWEEWLRGEPDLGIVQGYDTVDRDLDALGMAVERIPLEVGVMWRLHLPRGEEVEAWEPGNAGLTPPKEVAQLIDDVIAEKPLIPMPPPSTDRGVVRFQEMLEAQRQALLSHDPGTRLGADPENLHQHRVAARRARAFLRATRAYVDPSWSGLLARPLRDLGEATGPVRDLDVLLEHVRAERGSFDEAERQGFDALIARLESERALARHALLAALDGDSYRALLTRLRLPPRLGPGVDAMPIQRIARREFRRFAGAVDRLGKRPGDRRIHDLRIRLKRVRYASELAAPPGKRGRRFLDAARALQDLLGEHQDAVAAEQHLRVATAVDAQTSAAFVAGRLAERQRLRRERVTRRLPDVWKRLRKAGARLH